MLENLGKQILETKMPFYFLECCLLPHEAAWALSQYPHPLGPRMQDMGLHSILASRSPFEGGNHSTPTWGLPSPAVGKCLAWSSSPRGGSSCPAEAGGQPMLLGQHCTVSAQETMSQREWWYLKQWPACTVAFKEYPLRWSRGIQGCHSSWCFWSRQH